MAVAIPSQAVRDAQAADAGLWEVLLAIAGPESGWRAEAVGDGGCSLGYLQMNQCGGLGAGHSEDELLDGVSNFRLGAEHIRAEISAGRSLYAALWPWSAREAAWELYGRIAREGIEGVEGPPTLPPVLAESTGPVLALASLLFVLWWTGG